MWSTLLLVLYCIGILAVLPTLTLSSGGGGSSSAYYDKSFTLFSDTGDLLQVKYARLAGLQGQTVLCAGVPSSTSKDGNTDQDVKEVIICMPSQKIQQVLLDRRSVDKVSRIDNHIYVIFSGLAGDGRALIREIREFCINFRSNFGMGPSVLGVAQEIANVQYEATTAGGKRPYGVQVLIVGYDEDSHNMEIYRTEPSGEIAKFRAIAIGKNSDNLNIRLEREWPSTIANSPVDTTTEAVSTRSKVSKLFSRLLHLARPSEKKVSDQDAVVAEEEEEVAEFYTLKFDNKTKKVVKDFLAHDDL